jgi:hypothetical protein
MTNPSPLPATPYMRVVVDNSIGASASVVAVMPCPWPGVPTPYLPGITHEVTGWQCCDDGPHGLVVEVTVHLPGKPGDPAFTVNVVVGEEDFEHLLTEHGFFPRVTSPT